MKHPILIAALLFVVTMSVSAQKKGDAAAVEGLIETYQNSLNEGSLEGVLSVFSGSAVVLPPNAPPATDRAAIENRYSGIVSSNIDIHMSLKEVVYGKNIAYGWLMSTGSIDGDDGRSTIDSKSLVVFIREDGTWKIDKYMFSGNSSSD